MPLRIEIKMLPVMPALSLNREYTTPGVAAATQNTVTLDPTVVRK